MRRSTNSSAPVKVFLITLITWSLVFTGLFLIMLSILGERQWGWSNLLAAFIREVGLLLAAVMAGTILHESLLRDEMLRRISERFDERLDDRIPRFGGLRYLDHCRRNSPAYYSWVIEQRPQDLFFAGRSVLHRINADIQSRIGSSAEEILLRRLREGSRISIAFLDPRIDVLERLAAEENQRLETMLGDIAISIGICHRLNDLLLRNSASLPTQAQLRIRIYDAVPYFAYHKQDDQVLVGFYFRSDVGSSSASYEVVDEKTKEAFGDHFREIVAGATANWILDFDGAHGTHSFNAPLFEELRRLMSEKLGSGEADRLIKRRVSPRAQLSVASTDQSGSA
jgi:hypothetical protein